MNNAGVTLFGRFEEVPPEAFRRVIETNLFGYVYGARAVLPYFREQGSGLLINNASRVAYVGQPYTNAYVTSKHAIRGFTECLRQELIDEPDIHVCTLLPATIDTALFHHAANYSGRAAKPMNPVYSAEMTAETIVRLARSPKRGVFVGGAGPMIALQHTLAPAMAEPMLARAVDRDHLQDRPAPPTPGSLFEPMAEWTGISGGWSGMRPERMNGGGALLGSLLLAVGVALGLYALQRSGQGDGGEPIPPPWAD